MAQNPHPRIMDKQGLGTEGWGLLGAGFSDSTVPIGLESQVSHIGHKKGFSAKDSCRVGPTTARATARGIPQKAQLRVTTDTGALLSRACPVSWDSLPQLLDHRLP